MVKFLRCVSLCVGTSVFVCGFTITGKSQKFLPPATLCEGCDRANLIILTANDLTPDEIALVHFVKKALNDPDPNLVSLDTELYRLLDNIGPLREFLFDRLRTDAGTDSVKRSTQEIRDENSVKINAFYIVMTGRDIRLQLTIRLSDRRYVKWYTDFFWIRPSL